MTPWRLDGMTHRELAKALNRSKSTIGEYIAAGMPTDSVSAAQEWLRKSVRIRKATCATTRDDWRALGKELSEWFAAVEGVPHFIKSGLIATDAELAAALESLAVIEFSLTPLRRRLYDLGERDFPDNPDAG